MRARLALGVVVLSAACGLKPAGTGGGGGGTSASGGGTSSGTGGGTSSSGGGTTSTGGGSGDALSTDEASVNDRGNESQSAVQALAVAADSLFSFDPTVDPTQSSATNADRIFHNIRDNLGSTDGGFPDDAGTTGCGTVSLTGTTVSVDFGTGCTLRSGATISGSASVGVAVASGTATLTLTFTQLDVNGRVIDGTGTWSTSNGSTFTATVNISAGGTTYSASGFTITGTAGTITLDGTLTVTAGDASTTMVLTGVMWNRGDCYPSSGTVKATRGLISTTTTFTSASATSGKVSVKVGAKTVTICLPAYGTCGLKDGGC
jgi:hypothetical protein